MRLGLAVGGIVLLGLVVVVAVALLWLGLRRHGDRRRAEHDEEANRAAEQVRETIPAQAERERRDIVSLAALLAEHCWLDLATSWLPRVGDVNDPVALGVHPASALEDLDGATEKSTEASVPGPPARVPVYVPRDLDAKLDAALAAALTRGGLVLVRGDSTVGKSRAAFEAMRRLPGDLWLLVPYHLGSLRALLDGGVELCDVVVWLDDLERYLDAGGLEVELLPRLVGEGTGGWWCWPPCGPASTTSAAQNASVARPSPSVMCSGPSESCWIRPWTSSCPGGSVFRNNTEPPSYAGIRGSP